MTIRFQTRPILVIGAVLVLLTACNAGQSDMKWARAALERNPDIEIAATDAANSVFTVRVKKTGELRTLRADQVIATLPPPDIGAGPAPVADAPAPAPIVAPDVEPDPEPAPAEEFADAAEPAATTETLSQNSVVAAGDMAQPGGKGVLAAGPGYSIKRGEPQPYSAAGARKRTADARATPASTSAVEHRNEPIVCQGGRLLHIDSRNLEFDGDAVSAQDGCEIHITNSRITARGLGVFASAASVHIKNSSIEGASGSVEATNGAQVYVESSTFKGLSRRLDTATVHDMGGNVWN